MKKHHITIRFDTKDEATRFKWLLTQLALGVCGLRAIACSLRRRLQRVDISQESHKANISDTDTRI